MSGKRGPEALLVGTVDPSLQGSPWLWEQETSGSRKKGQKVHDFLSRECSEEIWDGGGKGRGDEDRRGANGKSTRVVVKGARGPKPALGGEVANHPLPATAGGWGVLGTLGRTLTRHHHASRCAPRPGSPHPIPPAVRPGLDAEALTSSFPATP